MHSDMKLPLGCCLICISSLTGCTLNLKPDDSKPIPIKDALATLQQQLHDAGPVTLERIGDPNVRSQFDGAIAQARCASRSSDPLVPVVTGAISLQIQGTITKAGAGAVSASVTPSGTYTYTVTKGQQQQVTVPITFVPLSGLANFYLGQVITPLSNLPDDGAKHEVIEPLLRNWRDLRAAAKQDGEININYDDTATCPKNVPNPPPHVVVPQSALEAN